MEVSDRLRIDRKLYFRSSVCSLSVCLIHKVKVEEDPYPDQLTMADGTKTQTEGKVQLKFKCGGYRGTVQVKVFLGL